MTTDALHLRELPRLYSTVVIQQILVAHPINRQNHIYRLKIISRLCLLSFQKQALFSIALVLFVFIMVINVLLNAVLKGGNRDEK